MDKVPDGGVNALIAFSKCCPRKGTRHTAEGGSGRGKGGGWGRQGKTQCRGHAPAPALHPSGRAATRPESLTGVTTNNAGVGGVKWAPPGEVRRPHSQVGQELRR